MKIDNEVARITYLPQSRLFAWLDNYYSDEVIASWHSAGQYLPTEN